MLRYPGGIIRSNPSLPTTSIASGVWSVAEAYRYRSQGIWPVTELQMGLFGSATSTASTIVAPASIMAGDLIVLADFARGNPTPTDVVPTNFTRVGDNTWFQTNDHRMVASYKIAGGTEGGTTITGLNGGSSNAKAMVVFRGQRPVASVTPSTPAHEHTTGDPSAQSVTASGAAIPVLVFGFYGSSGAIDPRTFTVSAIDVKDGEITPATRLYLAYKIYNASPADVTIDMDDEGTNGLASFYLALTG